MVAVHERRGALLCLSRAALARPSTALPAFVPQSHQIATELDLLPVADGAGACKRLQWRGNGKLSRGLLGRRGTMKRPLQVQTPVAWGVILPQRVGGLTWGGGATWGSTKGSSLEAGDEEAFWGATSSDAIQ